MRHIICTIYLAPRYLFAYNLNYNKNVFQIVLFGDKVSIKKQNYTCTLQI